MSRSGVIGTRTNPRCIDDGAYKNRLGRSTSSSSSRINPTSIGSAGTVGTMLCRRSAANFSLSLSLSPSPLSIPLGRSADKGSAGRIRRFWRTRHWLTGCLAAAAASSRSSLSLATYRAAPFLLHPPSRSILSFPIIFFFFSNPLERDVARCRFRRKTATMTAVAPPTNQPRGWYPAQESRTHARRHTHSRRKRATVPRVNAPMELRERTERWGNGERSHGVDGSLRISLSRSLFLSPCLSFCRLSSPPHAGLRSLHHAVTPVCHYRRYETLPTLPRYLKDVSYTALLRREWSFSPVCLFAYLRTTWTLILEKKPIRKTGKIL